MTVAKSPHISVDHGDRIEFEVCFGADEAGHDRRDPGREMALLKIGAVHFVECGHDRGILHEQLYLDNVGKGAACFLHDGFEVFSRQARGFMTSEATLIGTETRTSGPVRIVRDAEKLESISTPGLYPCGEGAGYAGGIVSAAIDGMRCAKMAGENLLGIIV